MKTINQEQLTNVTTSDSTLEESIIFFESIISLIRSNSIKIYENEYLKFQVIEFMIQLSRICFTDTIYTEIGRDKVFEILDNLTNIEIINILAACLLRLLSETDMKWLSEMPWRPKIITFLDSHFSEKIYQINREYSYLQTHEKYAYLSKIVSENESLFLKNLEGLKGLTSIENISVYRQKLMSLLNSTLGRMIFHPFLPSNIEMSLRDLFKGVDNYIANRESLNIIDSRTKLTEINESFIQILRNKNTLYSNLIIDGICYKISQLIDKDFANNKAIQPAEIKVDKCNKKYPLHLVGNKIKIGFILKNESYGYAYEVKLIVLSDYQVKIDNEEIEIGKLLPLKNQVIEIKSEIIESSNEVNIELEIEWQNFDKTQHRRNFSFIIESQRNNIDWLKLERTNPYSLNPIVEEQQLAGRKDVLNRLIANIISSNIDSSIILGQKRVGKTSIATVLKLNLEQLGYLVVNLDGGQYVEERASGTIKNLGRKICDQIRRLEVRAKHIDIPSFDNSLSPLDDFLDNIFEIMPEKRIVIVLDEFDELPKELYMRSSLGNSLFLSMRSLSSRPNLGFVLVGGEKMAYIIDCQGTQLNKWPIYSVDYFSRESNWNDYKELVQYPVKNILDYTLSALETLHNVTAGNPFFTKLVCRYVFETSVKNRDCYITDTEINQAIEASVLASETASNTFAHFWEDGIVELDEKYTTEKSVRRRKILIALSDELTRQSPVSGEIVRKNPLVKDIASVENDLREFVARKVLISSGQEESYDFKVPLFHKWLKGRGIGDLIANITDIDSELAKRQQQEKLKIQSIEIVSLIKNWSHYKGLPITEDKVRSWLDQFPEITDQRVMLILLQKLRFYSNSWARDKMGEIHAIVKRNLTRILPSQESRKIKQSDILVSYIDGVGKSGAAFASLYAEEANLYVDNLVEKSKIATRLQNMNDIKALVFIDDFVGTGNSASGYLTEIDASISEIVVKLNIKIVFVALVAFITGYRKLQNIIPTLKMPVELSVCETLYEEDKCFHDESKIFSDLKQRETARKAAYNIGKKLEKECPLGYGDLELAVVFERGCPNNTLPILWSQSTSLKWEPLFKRL